MTFRDDIERMTRNELIDYVGDLEARLMAAGDVRDNQAPTNLQRMFGLSPKEADLLIALSDGRSRSKESLLTAMYSDRPNEEPEIKIIDVFICKIRRKLEGSGVNIETIWGRGYVIADTAPLLKAMAFETLPPAETPEVGVGRPQGTYGRRKGSVRDDALKFLRSKADEKGRVKLTSAEFSRGVGFPYSGATVLRTLEQGGALKVLKAPRAGNHRSGRGGPWLLEMAA